jgi:hypothetical protein
MASKCWDHGLQYHVRLSGLIFSGVGDCGKVCRTVRAGFWRRIRAAGPYGIRRRLMGLYGSISYAPRSVTPQARRQLRWSGGCGRALTLLVFLRKPTTYLLRPHCRMASTYQLRGSSLVLFSGAEWAPRSCSRIAESEMLNIIWQQRPCPRSCGPPFMRHEISENVMLVSYQFEAITCTSLIQTGTGSKSN